MSRSAQYVGIIDVGRKFRQKIFSPAHRKADPRAYVLDTAVVIHDLRAERKAHIGEALLCGGAKTPKDLVRLLAAQSADIRIAVRRKADRTYPVAVCDVEQSKSFGIVRRTVVRTGENVTVQIKKTVHIPPPFL